MNRNITFKLLDESDIPLLHQWFQIPHIKKWYARNEVFTLEMIAEKYVPRINQFNHIPNYIVYLDLNPVGYIQLYRLVFSLPEGVDNYNHQIFYEYKSEEIAGIDLFVANEELLGTGFGSQMLDEFIIKYVEGKFKAIVVDPRDDNERAILFFKKNGFIFFTNDFHHQLMIYRVR